MTQAEMMYSAVGIGAAAVLWLARNHLQPLLKAFMDSSAVPATPSPAIPVTPASPSAPSSDRELSVNAFLAVNELIAFGTRTNNKELIAAAHLAGRAMFQPTPLPPASV